MSVLRALALGVGFLFQLPSAPCVPGCAPVLLRPTWRRELVARVVQVAVVAVLVAVLDVARAVAVGLVVVAVVLVAVLVLCVVLYRERNGSTIYVKNFPTVLFLVKEIAKLERERFVFCPRLFREGGGHSDDQAQLTEKEPLIASHIFGKNIAKT